MAWRGRKSKGMCALVRGTRWNGFRIFWCCFFSGREIAADWRCWFDRLNDWDIVLKWLDVEVLFLNSALSDEILLMEFQSIHLFQYKNTKFLINCLQKPSLLNYLLPQKESLFPWVSICQTAQHRSHPPIFSFSNGIEIAKQTAKTYIHTRLAECPSQRNRWFAYTGNAACQIWDFAVSLEHSTHTWRRPAAMPEYKLANLRIFFPVDSASSGGRWLPVLWRVCRAAGWWFAGKYHLHVLGDRVANFNLYNLIENCDSSKTLQMDKYDQWCC